MKKLFVPVLCVLLFSCTEKKHYSYSETLPQEIKISKRKLIELEAKPGFEEEKAAIRNNIAIGESAHLQTIVNEFEINYMKEHNYNVNEEDEKEAVAEFKKEIKYDSLKAEFDWILQKNK